MSVKEGYKQTEIGVIPQDWEIVTLKDISSRITNGFVGVATTHYVDEANGILYLQGYNIEENAFNLNGVKYVSKEFNAAHAKSILKTGDLLTIQTGDVGLTTYVTEELAGANCHALVITKTIKQKVNPIFTSYYLNFKETRARLKLLEIGSTMKHLNVGDLLHFKIIKPELIEQEKIAKALSDTDAYIDSLEKLIAKKQLIKEGLMKKLLTPKESWIQDKLGNIANITRGASPRPIDSPVWFDDKSQVGWVRISDVSKSNRYLEFTEQKLSNLGILHSRFVPKNSLIMSICATIGKPIISKIDICIHDGFVVFDNLKIDRTYLFYYLKYIESDWRKNGQTGSQMNLNTDLINNTPISYPKSEDEQTEIANRLDDISQDIEEITIKLEKAQAIKQGMMQKLLTGEIRLINLPKQP